jgi:hypothetical protein
MPVNVAGTPIESNKNTPLSFLIGYVRSCSWLNGHKGERDVSILPIDNPLCQDFKGYSDNYYYETEAFYNGKYTAIEVGDGVFNHTFEECVKTVSKNDNSTIFDFTQCSVKINSSLETCSSSPSSSSSPSLFPLPSTELPSAYSPSPFKGPQPETNTGALALAIGVPLLSISAVGVCVGACYYQKLKRAASSWLDRCFGTQEENEYLLQDLDKGNGQAVLGR